MEQQRPEIMPTGVELYAFDDIPHWRQDILDKTRQSLEATFPRDYGGVRLELSNLAYDDKAYTPSEERKARLNKGKLFVPLKGTVTLRDAKTNEVLDQVKRRTVLSAPYLTDRGVFIHGGSHYSSVKQARLVPGIYTRIKNNGGLEAHFNVKPGTGNSFRVEFEPDTAKFRLNVAGSGLSLYPVLSAMGVSDDELRDAWGESVFNANVAHINPRDINKLYEKLYKWDADPELPLEERANKVRERLSRGVVLRSTLRQTVGDSQQKRAADSILERARRAAGLEPDDEDERPLALDDIVRSSKKLIAINRGEARPDDRDALFFKRVLSTGDLISERIKIDADKTARTLMRKLSKTRTLKNLPPNFLNAYTEKQLVGNSLSSPTEETNPILLREQLFRITQMGPGGIGSENALTETMQNVSPSEFGFIDPLAGPESSRAGIDVRATYDSRLGTDGRIYQRFYNPRQDQYEWKSAYDLIGKTVSYGK